MDVADEAFLETESNIAYQIQYSKYQRSLKNSTYLYLNLFQLHI